MNMKITIDVFLSEISYIEILKPFFFELQTQN